jgi:hypothetical protein
MPPQRSWIGVLGLAVLGLAVLGLAPSALQAQDWRSITTLRRFSGEELLRVKLEYGAGRLTIGPGSESSLYRATLRYDANAFRPVNRYANGQLNLGIEGGSIRSGNLRAGRLDLSLGPQVPLDLDLKFGAAEAEVELGGLRIREASIQTGASGTRVRVSQPNREACSSATFEVGAARFEATGLGNLNCEDVRLSGGVGEVILDFSGEWRNDASAEVDMGLGSLTLRVPRGLGVSVRKSGVLASFDSQGLIKRGNVYYSENFERAEHKLMVTIDAALGAIKVQWVDGALGSR